MKQSIKLSRAGTMLAAIFFSLSANAAESAARPLKIYIMAGQSNMNGNGAISTMDYMADDPQTAPLLKAMRDDDGNPRVSDRVWVSSFTGLQNKPGHEHLGRLRVGLGARADHSQLGDNFGPEYPFGVVMEQAYEGPILIIKTSWGGQSLCVDFRPPSAGKFTMTKELRKSFIGRGGNYDEWQAKVDEQTGQNYRWMMEHVKSVLRDLKRVYPDYDEKQGHELAGFVWFQGWNDYIDSTAYPDQTAEDGYKAYTEVFAHFIRDIRKELNAPDMPFVIGVAGWGGEKAEAKLINFRNAQAAIAEWPEFQGNVVAVQTAPFWDERMEALQDKKARVEEVLRSAYVITDEGLKDSRDTTAPGWEPVGTSAPDERIWRYTTFDPITEKDKMPKEGNEKKRFREIELPPALTGWHEPGFDDSQWQSGKTPIGTGSWQYRTRQRTGGIVQNNSDWGGGEFLCMRTTFDVEDLDYEQIRLAVMSNQGYDVYLNGGRIDIQGKHTYIWYADNPVYREILLNDKHKALLKKGRNILAVYTNVGYDSKSGEPKGSVDVLLEGITKEGLAYINSEEYLLKQYARFCTPEETRICLGSGGGGWIHYLGSAKIYSQMSRAFAEALIQLAQQKEKAE